MNNIQIDKQIKTLQTRKHINTIKGNLKKHCYNTLFFTYQANYKYRVHFSYLAYASGHYCYAILCKGDTWLADGSDDGHQLDIVKLLNNEAIFMNWKEAVRDMCPECKKYLPLSQVVRDNAKAIRREGDRRLEKATLAKETFYQWATRLEEVANST